MSRDGWVGIVSEMSYFYSSKLLDRLWVPPKALFSGQQTFSLAVKQPGRETNNSLPSIDEVKNTWIFICAVVFSSAQGQLYLCRTCYGPEDFVPAACLRKESTFDPPLTMSSSCR